MWDFTLPPLNYAHVLFIPSIYLIYIQFSVAFTPAASVCVVFGQINAMKNEKVENLNQIFTEVQRDVKSISKGVAPQTKKQTQVEEENV